MTTTPTGQNAAKAAKIMGYSVEKRPIELYTFGNGPVSTLFIAGVHGDEIEGWDLAERFLSQLQIGEYKLPENLTLHFCPKANPDGCAHIQRTNLNKVDLNRNLPTQNWSPEAKTPRTNPGHHPGSEPENKVLMQIIEAVKPQLIVSFHSYEKPMVNYDGEFSRGVSEKMAAANGLEAKGDIGYPTPGSFGNYAAIERKIPTVTLEILRGQNLDAVWKQHRAGLIAALEWASNL